MLTAIWDILLVLSPWLLLGTVVAGVMHVVLPPDWLARQLRGGLGVVRAVVLGVPLPLCSCGVIPVALSLRNSGASRGSVVGFLVATPQTGVDSILVSAGMLGWPFAVFKLLSAAVTGLLAGTIVDETAVPTDEECDRQLPQAVSRKSAGVEFLQHADMLLRSIWHWLAIGVVVSAAINYFVPPGSFNALGNSGPLLGMLMVLLISLPLYVCATASVPIAAALVVAGMPIGSALVFLMAGPATNIATIGAIYRALGSRALAIYLVTIVVGSIAGGLLFEWLFAASISDVGSHSHHGGWIAEASAWILLTLLAYYATSASVNWWSRRAHLAPSAGPAIAVPVEGMTCQGCVAKLTKTLHGDKRVTAASVELSPGQAKVQGDLDRQSVCDLVAKAGFHVPE